MQRRSNKKEKKFLGIWLDLVLGSFFFFVSCMQYEYCVYIKFSMWNIWTFDKWKKNIT